MAILVTGGTGYIGSHTVIELHKNGYEVVIVDNLCNSKLEVLNRIEKISGIRPKFYKVTVQDEENLRKVFENEHITDVIHFAGLKSVGESVLKPDLYQENNVHATQILLKVMKNTVLKTLYSHQVRLYMEYLKKFHLKKMIK
jgi:UDP-glucose 4-epimerase